MSIQQSFSQGKRQTYKPQGEQREVGLSGNSNRRPLSSVDGEPGSRFKVLGLLGALLRPCKQTRPGIQLPSGHQRLSC